jgi:uncharacterized membrane protein YfcA
LEVLVFAAGIVAGFLGALVGIGGGVLIVPLLNGFMGVPFREATGISLVGVLATSGSAVMAPQGKRLLNLRLAIVLLVFSVSGALAGATTFTSFSDRTYELIFAVTAAVIGALMFLRFNTRNIQPVGQVDPGMLGGVIHDDDTGADAAYRVRRLPAALLMSFVAGVLASFIGIGGGILIVPVLNTLCGVPLRVAAATSVLMIGVTAVPGVAAHWAEGFLTDFHLPAAAAIGVLVGFQLGLRIGPRAPVKWLKMTLAAILGAVAIQYLFFK